MFVRSQAVLSDNIVRCSDVDFLMKKQKTQVQSRKRIYLHTMYLIYLLYIKHIFFISMPLSSRDIIVVFVSAFLEYHISFIWFYPFKIVVLNIWFGV